MKQLRLNNGQSVPAIGFGTWKLSDSEVEAAVSTAIAAGYRLIDTAKIYGNEPGVGRAVRGSGLDRRELFVTTKLWPSDFGYDSTMVALDESLERLGLDYVDLYLIHWPGDAVTARHESWRALTEINGLGTAKIIGVSNFDERQLRELIEASGVTPAVNQIEFHPFLYQKQQSTVEFCAAQRIVVEAYSPLAQASALRDKTAVAIAEKLHKTPAQVLLRWAIQHGTVPIPKSGQPSRIKQNLAIFDFELGEAEMARLNQLGS